MGARKPELTHHFVQADVTKFFPLLHRVRWQADCIVLNLPWDLHWYRDRLTALAEADCYAVRQAFPVHDGRTSRETIDATVAGLCMAYHFLTAGGEGYAIANQATLDRLILRPDAPHAALREHIWAHVIVPGNICQRDIGPDDPVCADATAEFRTGIIFFARDHTVGFDDEDTRLIDASTTLAQVADLIGSPEFRLARRGTRIRPGNANLETPALWDAARDEWAILQGGRVANQWNIYLDADGTLRTNLSRFDTASGRANKQEADRLFQLHGKHPMHLVMARESRLELNRAVSGTRWRVAPAVVDAVAKAVADYDEARAPLYPLNAIQRLGYVDEYEMLTCVKDLGTVFKAGLNYELKSETVRTTRAGTKMNLEGGLDDVQYNGAELAIYLLTREGTPMLFMDARLMDANVRLSIQDEGAPSPINFTLQQLANHFAIPEVPDVATLNPEGYQRNLALLHEIEQLVA